MALYKVVADIVLGTETYYVEADSEVEALQRWDDLEFSEFAGYTVLDSIPRNKASLVDEPLY